MLIGWEPELLAQRIARAADTLASLSLFGVLLFVLVVAWREQQPALRARLLAFTRVALAAKLLAAAFWMPLQAIRMAGEDYVGSLAELTRFVALDTSFGRSLLLRTGLFVLAVLVAGRLKSLPRLFAAVVIGAFALALQARLGHASAQENLLLPPLVALHVLAAGAWLGGLIPLGILLASLPGQAAAQATRRFSALGLASVLLLAVTACLQSVELVGGFGGWFGTAYGQVAILKAIGFGVLLLLAAVNRFVLTPRLSSGGRGLIVSVAIETALGLVVVALSVLLATLPPGAHIQPVWPFPLRPDFSEVVDPYVRNQLVLAAALVAVALCAMASLFWRPTRIAGPVLAVIALIALPTPNLRLLAAPAVPASFYRSETGYTAASIARGEELLRKHCTPDCFRGWDDPSDLTPYNVWKRTDGDLFDWLTRVFDVIGHSPFAHGTIGRLSERERWHLIDYFRARVAGAAVKADERWRYAIPPPEMRLACSDGTASFGSLRGRMVRLIVKAGGDTRSLALPPDAAVTTVIVADRDLAIPPPSGTCWTSQPDAWTALAIAGGLDVAALEGTQFVVDADGWMRSRILPHEVLEPEDWRREIALIEASPLKPAKGSGAHAH